MTIPCLLVLFGCPKRPAPSMFPPGAILPDPETCYLELLNRSGQVRTLQGMARIRLETGQEKATLDAVIACDRQGRLRFEVLDWLNHVVFLALFDRQGFVTYSAPENEYAEGPDEPARIEEILGIPLKAEELAALALGDPFLLPVTDPTLRLTVDRGALLLDVESSSLGPRYLVWLDEGTRPERVFVMRPRQGREGIGDLQVDYGRYRKSDAVDFPYRIRVTATGLQDVLQVDYQRILLNESLDEGLFSFTPPTGATNVTQ